MPDIREPAKQERAKHEAQVSPYSDVECHEIIEQVRKQRFNPEPHLDFRALVSVILYMDRLLNGK